MRIKPELFRVHAHVCGDGWLYFHTQKRTKSDIAKYHRKNCLRSEWIIGYSNNDKNLLKNFKKDIKVLLPTRWIEEREDEIRVEDKQLFEKLRLLGAGSSHKWFVHQDLMNSGKKFITFWLQAFFDDEATVENSSDHKRIRIKSVNLSGLNSTRKMLEKLKINSNITGPNCDHTWYLCISAPGSVTRFINKIGFSSFAKRLKAEKLESAAAGNFR